MARNARRNRKGSVESLKMEEAHQMLDLSPLTNAEALDDIDLLPHPDPNDENIAAPKMNTLVGLIRLANFISATTVNFVLIKMLMDDKLWTFNDHIQNMLSSVQLTFLVLLSTLVYIDSIGTVSFCWREYGELSSLHTDATSCIFTLCSNRWMFRLGSGLIFITSFSLPVFDAVKSDVLPHTFYWLVALISSCFIFSLLGLCLSFCVPSHRVPWLLAHMDTSVIRDESDIWKKNPKKIINEEWRLQSTLNNCLYQTHRSVQILGMFLCVSSFLVAMIFHSMTAIIICISLVSESQVPNIFLLVAIAACLLIEGACLFVLIMRFLDKKKANINRKSKPWIPMYIWLITPYILSCSVRQFLDNQDHPHLQEIQKIIGDSLDYTTMVGWFYGMSLLVIFGMVHVFLGIVINAGYISTFWRVNFMKNEGKGRKRIRVLDTLASFLTLIGLVIGMTSIFIDQYDIEIEPDGIAKEVVDTVDNFRQAIGPLQTSLDKIIKKIDQQITCQRVYETLGTGATVTLLASFIPAASSMASVGTRTAYYGVRAGNAMTNLAKKFKKSRSLVINISMTGIKLANFVKNNLKKLILTANSVDIGRIMPLLPPVILGIYVLFGVFWPSRVVFFTAKQRRSHMSSRFWSWTLALFVLIVAIVINTVVLDEIVQLLDDNIGVAKFNLKHNLGWKLAMSSSAFALVGTFLNWIVALTLLIQTDTNHENLTNAEKEWQDELEKRELVTVKTPFGNIYQKRTHLKYLRSRISPWTWVLPILITLMACGFGIWANFHPKLEIIREPRGPFGRMVNRVHQKVSLFEADMNSVKSDTAEECLPLATLDDVLETSDFSNILVSPVEQFYNLTQETLAPLKQSLHGFRTQLVLDIDEEVFGGNMEAFWRATDLQYIGLIFTIPRFICLLILVFGCFMVAIFKCTMQVICQSLEPRKIVDAYGKVALFSMVYVVGAQLSLFNILSSFGIPFYHIYVRFGPGFVYDVVADSLLIATYIGMNNEFFFAIPKRKTTVTYTVPGASDPGPNIPGQII